MCDFLLINKEILKEEGRGVRERGGGGGCVCVRISYLHKAGREQKVTMQKN